MPCLIEAETLAARIGGTFTPSRGNSARVVDASVEGHGAALSAGAMDARGRFAIAGDSLNSSQIDGLVARSRDGADLVIGNRFTGGIAPGAVPPPPSCLNDPASGLIGRLFLGVGAGESHCGFRGFRARALGPRSAGMESASGMVVRGAVAGLRIDEVPCRLSPDGRDRKPPLQAWRDGRRRPKLPLVFGPRWPSPPPGCAPMVLDALASAAPSFGPIRVDRVTFDLDAFTTACLAAAVAVVARLPGFGVLSRSSSALAGRPPNSAPVAALARALAMDRLAGLILFGTAPLPWTGVGFGVLADPGISRRVAAGLTLAVIGPRMQSTASFGVPSIPTARLP